HDSPRDLVPASARREPPRFARRLAARAKRRQNPGMNGKPFVAALMGLSVIAVAGAQSNAPSADEITRTIAVAQKIGTSEPLTDAEKQYGFGLRLLDRQGPVITTI